MTSPHPHREESTACSTLLLIYGRRADRAAVPDDVMASEMAAYNEFTRHIADRGAHSRPARRSIHRRPPPPSASATARRSRPTGRSPRPRRSSAASTSSRPPISTRRSTTPRGSPAPSDGSIEVRPIFDFGAQAAAARRRNRDRAEPALTAPPDDAAHDVVDRLFREESGAGGRDAHPRPRRLRPGRGGGPGRVHHRARDVAGAGRPGQPGGVDHDHGAQPGDRSAAAAAAPAREDRDARSRGRDRGRACGDRTRGADGGRRDAHQRRSTPPDLHLLPPGPAARRRAWR